MSWDWDKLRQQQQRGEFKDHSKEPKKERREIPSWEWTGGYIIIWIALTVGLFFPLRWLHYKFAYEVKVEKQIIEMVKPEALKDQYRKIE